MRSSGLFYLLIGMLVLTFLVLFFADDGNGNVFGYDGDTLARTAALLILLLALSSSFVFRGTRFSKVLRDSAIWILLGFGLVVGYAYQDELLDVSERVQSVLLPGQPVSTQSGDVIIRENARGEFNVSAQVNNRSVTMLFDTGATTVVLTERDAQRVGYDPDQLVYNVLVDTANGRTTAAPITLERMRIGDIERRNVRALVAENEDLSQSLLGRSFLDTLELYTVRGDELILTN